MNVVALQPSYYAMQATVAWCEHDPEQRKAFLPKLLAAVRLPPAELQHQVCPTGLLLQVCCRGACCYLMLELCLAPLHVGLHAYPSLPASQPE